jgi:hypothetical protein
VNELRIWVAMMLAKDVDACSALLRGEHVHMARLDVEELEFMKAMRFVSMDFSAIDFFESQLKDVA